jgi:hypothetical protein
MPFVAGRERLCRIAHAGAASHRVWQFKGLFQKDLRQDVEGDGGLS